MQDASTIDGLRKHFVNSHTGRLACSPVALSKQRFFTYDIHAAGGIQRRHIALLTTGVAFKGVRQTLEKNGEISFAPQMLPSRLSNMSRGYASTIARLNWREGKRREITAALRASCLRFPTEEQRIFRA